MRGQWPGQKNDRVHHHQLAIIIDPRSPEATLHILASGMFCAAL